tara:strand:+ start:445 stop:591 length:147 start_codon:yes stop_codon:yes gene_type:complete
MTQIATSVVVVFLIVDVVARDSVEIIPKNLVNVLVRVDLVQDVSVRVA